MIDGAVLVLDVGKTNSKLTLWDRGARLLETRVRANERVRAEGYAALDVLGIEAWFAEVASEWARQVSIAAIVPVAHGAAMTLLDGDRLAAPPLCYEEQPPADIVEAYARQRDDFLATGSPSLPQGLNLGLQLHFLETIAPALAEPHIRIVPFAQYWGWRLTGQAASERTSLGCHSDLWRPFEGRFSELALRRGWAERFAPLRHAGDRLGAITPDWAARTGLPADCVVLCGAHDSNAAFHGVRGHPRLEGRDVTVISTGTWFVAMRAPDGNTGPAPSDLDERRDVLINVDVDGRPAPSARFMGGREVEMLIGSEDSPLRDLTFTRDVAPLAIGEVLQSGAMVLPTFAPGVGPFPSREGRWIGPSLTGAARRAATGLYLGLVTDASLSLIGARDAIVVEGRFAYDASFLGMLASLRRDCDIYAARTGDGLALGALRLVDPSLRSSVDLTPIAPLDWNVAPYVERWRALAQSQEIAA